MPVNLRKIVTSRPKVSSKESYATNRDVCRRCLKLLAQLPELKDGVMRSVREGTSIIHSAGSGRSICMIFCSWFLHDQNRYPNPEGTFFKQCVHFDCGVPTTVKLSNVENLDSHTMELRLQPYSPESPKHRLPPVSTLPLAENTEDLSCLELAGAWASDWYHNHTICNETEDLPNERIQPSRLIYLEETSARIYEVSEGCDGSVIEYMTLSHRWGPNMAQLLRDDYEKTTINREFSSYQKYSR